MDLAVRALAADSGVLREISGGEAGQDRFAAVDLRFDAGTLALRCNPDTDEIIVEVSAESSRLPSISDSALSNLLGATIEDAWVLTNHRGFQDGFQLRFLSSARQETVVQFEVAASSIEMWLVVDPTGSSKR